MADAQRRLLDFARRSVAPFSLFRRTLCSLRIPHATPTEKGQHTLSLFCWRSIDRKRVLRRNATSSEMAFLQNFAWDDCYIAAGSAACTARRLRPFPHACGGNGNTQNRNATAVSSLMAHIPHGVGQRVLSLFCWRSIDRKRALRRNIAESETAFAGLRTSGALTYGAYLQCEGGAKGQKQKGAWAPFCA